MPKVLQEEFPHKPNDNRHSDGYFMDGYLKANLDHVKKQVTKRNFDSFLVITGREGFGKTTLALQIAKYLDKRFDIPNIVFTASQFQEAIENAPKYTAIVFDETMGYLGSRGATSKFNRMLVKAMSEMRSKNLFVILCIPNFFELDKYPAIHRSTGLIHVSKRGRFGSYDYRKKKNLYLTGKKFYEYRVSPSYTGAFTSYFPVDTEKYEKKKQEAIISYQKNSNAENVVREQRNKLIARIIELKLLTRKELAEIMGVSVDMIGYALAKVQNEDTS